MNLATRISAGALAIAASITAPIPRAEASGVQPPEVLTTQQLIKAGVTPAVALGIERAGVPVIDGRSVRERCEHPNPKYTIFGFYNSYYNVMVVCIQNIPTRELFQEVIYHEAVHLVQDCRTGIDSPSLYPGSEQYIETLWVMLAESKQLNILNSYDHTDWDVEIEAFFFEDKPEAVATGLGTFCF